MGSRAKNFLFNEWERSGFSRRCRARILGRASCHLGQGQMWDPIHLPENHLPEITFPGKTLGRNYINPNVHFPERALARNNISLNVHLPEITFP